MSSKEESYRAVAADLKVSIHALEQRLAYLKKVLLFIEGQIDALGDEMENAENKSD